MTMELRSPASIDEATRWLQASTSTIDTAANRTRLGPESIERTLTSGQRSPESTWALIDGDRVAGLVSGRSMPGGFRLVDIFAVSRPADARALLQRATDWARGSDEREASFGAPVGPLEQTPAADLVRELEQLGWQLLVTRQHYEIDAAQMSVRPHPLAASLQRAEPDDEPRLAALLQRIVADSLDVRDRESLAKHGSRAGQVLADELVEADPIEAVRFAVIDGRDAGVVVWNLLANGFGVVAFVGVDPDARGRGLARAMVAEATAALLDGGAHTLIADTDDVNVPMRRAFAAAGWEPTEARIDLTLR